MFAVKLSQNATYTTDIKHIHIQFHIQGILTRIGQLIVPYVPI